MSSYPNALRLGPPLPGSIAEELDQLAQIAMGDFSAVSSTPKVGASGDESRWSIQYYARCLVYRRKVSLLLISRDFSGGLTPHFVF